MIVIGEKINSTRKSIKEAIAAKDVAALQKMAIDQAQAGADYIDVNTGAFPEQEVELMEWLVKVVQEVVDIPLSLDSPNVEALEMGLKTNQKGTPIINSITAEKAKFDRLVPLLLKYQTPVLALAMDDNGITKNTEDRFAVAEKLIKDLNSVGIEQEKIFLDPLIQPVSVQNDFGRIAIDVIQRIKHHFSQVNTTCGLSNISFGLPQRTRLNRCFLIMAMTAGLDSAILDPLDEELMDSITTVETLLGKDRFCKTYIKAFR